MIVMRSGLGVDRLAALEHRRFVLNTPTLETDTAADSGVLAWLNANRTTVIVGVVAALGILWFVRR